MTTSPSKLNELNYAETPARALLEQIGWTYLPGKFSPRSAATSGTCFSGSAEEGLAPPQRVDDRRAGSACHFRP